MLASFSFYLSHSLLLFLHTFATQMSILAPASDDHDDNDYGDDDDGEKQAIWSEYITLHLLIVFGLVGLCVNCYMCVWDNLFDTNAEYIILYISFWFVWFGWLFSDIM